MQGIISKLEFWWINQLCISIFIAPHNFAKFWKSPIMQKNINFVIKLSSRAQFIDNFMLIKMNRNYTYNIGSFCFICWSQHICWDVVFKYLELWFQALMCHTTILHICWPQHKTTEITSIRGIVPIQFLINIKISIKWA